MYLVSEKTFFLDKEHTFSSLVTHKVLGVEELPALKGFEETAILYFKIG